jgi:exoribonuclease R
MNLYRRLDVHPKMISGVLHLTNKTRYGFTSRNVPMYLFRPFSTTQPIYIVGSSKQSTGTNVLALVEPLDTKQEIPRGNLLRILGNCGDWVAEREAVHWTYQPHKQPKVDITDLLRPSEDGRLDLRGFRTLHVDPPGCKDVDDCITFWEGKCVITIADVGAWVSKNPQLQAFAMNGQTLYDDGQAVRPMFPPALSEGLFSLLPDQDRFGVSLIVEMGKPSKVVRSIVRVTESYTYEEATPLRELKRWSEHCVGRDLPDDPHLWIEACMTYYNMHMAMELIKRGIGLLRSHNEPDRKKLERYESYCPEARRLAESAARYTDVEHREPHYGLGMVAYTHMTSPIRRWADTYNQMVLFDENPGVDIDYLNQVNKNAKKHDRDLFFLEQLQNPGSVTGIVLETVHSKTKVWVCEWKRVVSLPARDYPNGTRLNIEYYLDMNQPTWKKRMVMRASKDYLEQPDLARASDEGPYTPPGSPNLHSRSQG